MWSVEEWQRLMVRLSTGRDPVERASTGRGWVYETTTAISLSSATLDTTTSPPAADSSSRVQLKHFPIPAVHI